MKRFTVTLLAALVLVILAACSAPKKDASGPVKPVEAFYNAIVTQNRDQIGSIACADWEKDALREVDAFMGVKSELKDFSCSVVEEGSDQAVVTCKGSIAASYGAEVQNFSAEGKNYKVIKEQGEWRVCGY